eukprot:g13119.t2
MESHRPRSALSCVVSASSLRQYAKDLGEKPSDVSVEDLREIGRHVEFALREKGLHPAGELVRGDSASSGLNVAALFNATCGTRSNKEQDALLGAQDKVLAGLRAISSSLATDQHRAVRAALLPLVAQPSFIKKRKGYRQHLVQALTEAASGPVPPSALLPILVAKETGPGATDLALEVLERISREEDHGGTNDDTSKKGVIGLLHKVVAEVVTSGTTTKAGKAATKTKQAPPAAHLVSFLVQACSTLPDYVLVFAEDLLALAESGSSSARKLSLAVLEAVLERGRGKASSEGGAPDPALAAVLRFARSDGDATVRCSAFDTVAGYVGQLETISCSDHRDDNPFDDLENDAEGAAAARQRPETPPEDAGATETGGVDGSVGDKADRSTGQGETPGSPSGTRTPGTSSRQAEPAGRGRANLGQGAGGNSAAAAPPCTPARDLSGRASSLRQGEEDGGASGGPWGVGGALLLSLSASADALSADGSKAVRAKALACLLRILQVHGEDAGCLGGLGGGRSAVVSGSVKRALSTAAKGAWAALEAVASDGAGGAGQAASAGGGRHRKAADAARDLLILACVDARPVDLVTCFHRCCRLGLGAGAGAPVGAAEAKRALQDIARARFCVDIRTLLTAVSEVKAEDERGGAREDRDETENPGCFADSGDGAAFPLSDVLCEVLAGVDGEVIASLLRDALEAYAAGVDEHRRPNGGAAAATAPVLLRTLSLLAEAGGDHTGTNNATTTTTTTSPPGKNGQLVGVLAGSRHLFWRRLEQQMEEIGREDDDAGGGGGEDGGGGRGERAAEVAMVSSEAAVSELSELLGVFRLLASRSLVSPESSAALEALVFPTALSRRRLIRPAVGLALALDEPHRVLLSSLAVLQDAAFSRSSTHVGRACDYVRLIGVLARENASFVAAHVRERYAGAVKGGNERAALGEGEEGGRGGEDEDQEDYMAEASNREAMEWEIRRLREASVTSDGMLSCYTPFLLAIVKRRVADAAAAGAMRPPPSAAEATLPSSSSSSSSSSSCPRALCAAALFALSEYAVLSPRLAASEVLPLAEGLASDTREHAQIRRAAVGVLTRRELATDEIAAQACCNLLEDEDPRLRREVLARLGRLMRESRIKTAHLSRFALLLVDGCDEVRKTARAVFFDHLQPRPDTVARCLFETFFTLDAQDSVKRRVLQNLIAVALEAAPSQGLESLGAALVRKATETGDSQAAFFLSLVPPTVNSLEAAEVALRRGHLAHAPRETVSLVAAHFSKAARRGGGTPSSSAAAAAGTKSTTTVPPPKAQALEMAARIESLARAFSPRRGAPKRASARSRHGRRGQQVTTQGGDEAGSPAPGLAVEHGEGVNADGGGEARRGAGEKKKKNSALHRKKSGDGRPSKKRRRRAQDDGRGRGGGDGRSKATGNGKGKSTRDGVSVEGGDDEDEEEWEG